jgi:hypothetical protein
MKKITFIALLLLGLVLGSQAQSIEFTPLAGYTFGDKINFSGGEAHLDGGFKWGGALTICASQYNAIEFTYTRQLSNATAKADLPGTGFNNIDTPVAVNYVLVGGTRLMPVSEKVSMFGGMQMGIGIFGSPEDKFSSVTKFDFGFNGGAKIWFSEKIGLRLQANIDFPVTSNGGYYWWNPATGTSYGVTSFIPIVQFGFTGGIIFKIR